MNVKSRTVYEYFINKLCVNEFGKVQIDLRDKYDLQPSDWCNIVLLASKCTLNRKNKRV